MADEAAGATTTAAGGLASSAAAVKQIADAIDTLKSALGTSSPAGGGGGSEPPSVDPPEVDTGLSPNAAAAVERYRQTIRWMLGAFGAVALVVFGSVPFTDLGNATSDQRFWIIVGLAAVAVGVSFAIYAVSMVAEPEDSSLGELDQTNQRLAGMSEGRRKFRCSGFFPRNQARERMRSLLRDEQGDFGPPWAPPPTPAPERTAADLIDDIFSAQKARYVKAQECAERRVEFRRAQQAATEARATTTARWNRYAAAAAIKVPTGTGTEAAAAVPEDPAAQQAEPNPPAGPPPFVWAFARGVAAGIGAQLGSAETLWTQYTDALGVEESAVETLAGAAGAQAAADADLAGIDARLKVHLEHRGMVIDESLVMQIRGSFRSARRLLVIGAMLTAAGATAYASQLPPGRHADDPGKPSRPQVTADVKAKPDSVLHATATARGLRRKQRLLITVFGTTAGGERQSLYRSVVGPDGNGVVNASFDVPLEVGRFEQLSIGATRGNTPRDCDGIPVDEKGTTKTGFAARPRSQFGCVVIKVPRTVARPELTSSWDTSDPEHPAINFDAKAGGLGSQSQMRVAVVVANSAPHVVYSAVVGPGADGQLHVASRVTVPPEDTVLCVVARTFDGPPKESFPDFSAMAQGACPPESTIGTAVVKVVRPPSAP